jgi:hypothetical protein
VLQRPIETTPFIRRNLRRSFPSTPQITRNGSKRQTALTDVVNCVRQCSKGSP